MRIVIKNVMGEELFSHECEDNSHSKTLEIAVGRGIDLAGADLSRMHLEGVNLRGAQLRGCRAVGTNFRGADLGKADLQGAELEGSRFAGAQARCADLRQANLDYTRWENACLSLARMEGCKALCAMFNSADLAEANLSRSDLELAKFQKADLYHTKFSGARLYAAEFSGSNVGSSYLCEATVTGRLGSEDWLITGARPYLSIGPVGERNEWVSSFLTTDGIYVQFGSWYAGPLVEFYRRYKDVVKTCPYAFAAIHAHYRAWPATAEEEV